MPFHLLKLSGLVSKIIAWCDIAFGSGSGEKARSTFFLNICTVFPVRRSQALWHVCLLHCCKDSTIHRRIVLKLSHGITLFVFCWPFPQCKTFCTGKLSELARPEVASQCSVSCKFTSTLWSPWNSLSMYTKVSCDLLDFSCVRLGAGFDTSR